MLGSQRGSLTPPPTHTPRQLAPFSSFQSPQHEKDFFFHSVWETLGLLPASAAELGELGGSRKGGRQGPREGSPGRVRWGGPANSRQGALRLGCRGRSARLPGWPSHWQQASKNVTQRKPARLPGTEGLPVSWA